MSVESCPLCYGGKISTFLQRSAVPVHQNLLMKSQQEARLIVCADLDMMVCAECGFVFNAAFDPKLLSYGEGYDNNQGCSSSFQQHLNNLVDLLVNKKGVKNKQVIEIGCGQGQFLRRIVDEGDNYGVGFDPSYTGTNKPMNGRIESRYYDESCIDVPADVVICRHVIEHVSDPVALLKSVRAAIGDRIDAKVFFETPCVEWILRNGVVWDFFYEHCSLFSASSLSTAFQMAGFNVDDVGHVFGGQYLWLEASPVTSDVRLHGEKIFELATSYAEHEQALIQNWKQRILELSQSGGVAIWGAGAKGTTFAGLIDPDCQLINCLVDLNPNKQNKFVAGTGHEIIEPNSLSERGVRHAILMNPNYREENENILNNEGLKINLVT